MAVRGPSGTRLGGGSREGSSSWRSRQVSGGLRGAALGANVFLVPAFASLPCGCLLGRAGSELQEEAGERQPHAGRGGAQWEGSSRLGVTALRNTGQQGRALQVPSQQLCPCVPAVRTTQEGKGESQDPVPAQNRGGCWQGARGAEQCPACQAAPAQPRCSRGRCFLFLLA